MNDEIRWIGRLVRMGVLGLACCRGGEPADDPAPTARTVLPGEWTMMHFLGGPPSPGQITDTMKLDPSARPVHVRIERSRAGAGPDRACEAEAKGDDAWRALLAAMADPDLAAALAHPEQMPGLVLDAGYFACTHAGARIAVSDFVTSDATAPKATAALRRLSEAAGAVQRTLLALPSCAGL